MTPNGLIINILDIVLIAIEFSRFRAMYILIQHAISSGPARNYHTRWVYEVFKCSEKDCFLLRRYC